MLEWGAIPFSRGSSWPRDWTQVSCIAGGFFITEPLGESKTWILECKWIHVIDENSHVSSAMLSLEDTHVDKTVPAPPQEVCTLVQWKAMEAVQINMFNLHLHQWALLDIKFLKGRARGKVSHGGNNSSLPGTGSPVLPWRMTTQAGCEHSAHTQVHGSILFTGIWVLRPQGRFGWMVSSWCHLLHRASSHLGVGLGWFDDLVMTQFPAALPLSLPPHTEQAAPVFQAEI